MYTFLWAGKWRVVPLASATHFATRQLWRIDKACLAASTSAVQWIWGCAWSQQIKKGLQDCGQLCKVNMNCMCCMARGSWFVIPAPFDRSRARNLHEAQRKTACEPQMHPIGTWDKKTKQKGTFLWCLNCRIQSRPYLLVLSSIPASCLPQCGQRCDIIIALARDATWIICLALPWVLIRLKPQQWCSAE